MPRDRTAAERQRRRRTRQRDGLAALTIEVDEIAITETLIAAGLLDARGDPDRATLTAALQRVVDLWSRGVTRDYADS